MPEQPKISYVIASRNDGFCGDPMGRLGQTLTTLFAAHDASDYEVVIVDWGSMLPISGRLNNLGGCERFLHVPPYLAGADFHETRALNLGIRKARGEWIARLDQDTLVGDQFVRWFREHIVHREAFRDSASFSLRRDLPEDLVWKDWHNSGEKCWRGAVGILLAPAVAWYSVRGYFEGLNKRNHIEHDLCLRFQKLCGLRDIGPEVNYDFHHQFHPRPSGLADNILRSENVLLQMIEEGKFTNDENWGMKEHWDQIKETVL